MLSPVLHHKPLLKKLACLLIVVCSLSLSLNVHSEEGDKRHLFAINQQWGLVQDAIDPQRLKKLRFLALKYCGNMEYDNDVFVERATKIARSFMKKFDGIEQASKAQILAFLNENRAHLFCKKPLGGEEHYMVYAVKNNQISKLFTFFLNDLTSNKDTLSPNVNVIVGTSPSGSPETFLDFLQRKADEPDRHPDFKNKIYTKISQFRRLYNAKYFHEIVELLNLGIKVTHGRKDINQLNQNLGLFHSNLTDERKDKLHRFAESLCANLINEEINNPAEALKNSAYVAASIGMKIEIDTATDAQILSFLNQNIANLWCVNPFGGEEHYMSYAVQHAQLPKLAVFLTSLIDNKNKLVPNVNVIVGHTAADKPVTILDVIKMQANNMKLSQAQRDSFSGYVDEFRSKFQTKYSHELLP